MRKIIFAVLLASCGSDPLPSDPAEDGSFIQDVSTVTPTDAGFAPVCAPGRSLECSGPGGCLGGQICLPSGEGFGPCVCAPTPMDAGFAPDAQTLDATTRDATTRDVGFPDATVSCGSCDDRNPCTIDRCEPNGECSHDPAPEEGTTCTLSGSPGRCREGACCVGCWDGQRCQAGTSLEACGHSETLDIDTGSHGLCVQCDDSNECTTERCNNRACLRTNAAEYTPCAGGQCINLMCEACGGSGEYCCSGNSCDVGLTCNSGRCGSCGGLNEICCGTTCNAGLRCDGDNSRCTDCGGRNQMCCPGATPCEGMPCTGGQCLCGGLNQPCCPDNLPGAVCNSGLRCASTQTCLRA